jgi:hypothetical protein
MVRRVRADGGKRTAARTPVLAVHLLAPPPAGALTAAEGRPCVLGLRVPHLISGIRGKAPRLSPALGTHKLAVGDPSELLRLQFRQVVLHGTAGKLLGEHLSLLIQAKASFAEPLRAAFAA